MITDDYSYNCGEKGEMVKKSKIDNYHQENVGDEYQPFYLKFNDILDVYVCSACNDIMIFRSEWIDGAQQEEYGLNYLEAFGELIYPDIEHGNKQHIPNRIYNSYLSSIKVKNIDKALCLIGLRRTLEMICKDNGYTSGSLVKKLKDMNKDGIIPPVLDDLAVFLRTQGNKAAHGDDVDFSIPVVNNMVEFTSIIMNYIYVLPKKIEKAQELIQENINEQS